VVPEIPPQRRDLLVVTALRSEYRAVARRLPTGVALERCGMGPRAVSAWTVGRRPASYRAAAVLGLAGGLDPSLRAGDVVVATELRDEQGRIPLPGAAPLVAALSAAGVRVRSGPVACTSRVVGRRERQRLAESDAVAVDMESSGVVRHLRAVAGSATMPVAVVRVIADPAPGALLRPATLRNGARALRRLPTVASVLAEWAELVRPRTVLLAGPRSFCAGVERAIDAVERALRRYPHPVYVRREIVHNAHVVADLRRRGAQFVDELDEIPDGAVVVFSAHGVPRAVRAEAERRRLTVVDATCPLVTKVHQEVHRYANEGRSVILIGHAGHDETEGTLGQLPGYVQLVESAEQARRVSVPDPSRVAVLTQTTLAPDDTRPVAAVLAERFPGLAHPATEDICYATSNRQRAVREIAGAADLVLVLGSANSSNSHRLVEVAHRCGARAHLIEDATAIQPAWLRGADTVGLTAGASAPPYLVEEVLATLRELGGAEVIDRAVTNETLTFAPPRGGID